MGHRGNFAGFYLFAGICCPLIGICISARPASRGYATGLVFAVSYATGMALIILLFQASSQQGLLEPSCAFPSVMSLEER